MLLEEDTECFAFLAGHESFAAAEGAIKIAEMANKVRVKPLRVILNGLGKDAAFIILKFYCLFFYLFSAKATFTAQATVQPTIGLLPIPKKPIISTCAGTELEPAN